MNILYKQDTPFKGTFAFINLPSRKPALTRGKEQLSFSSENCDMLTEDFIGCIYKDARKKMKINY